MPTQTKTAAFMPQVLSVPATLPTALSQVRSKSSFVSSSRSFSSSSSSLSSFLSRNLHTVFSTANNSSSSILTTVRASVAAHESLKLDPIKKIEGVVRLPGSKSLSNRVLLLSMLASGKTRVRNLLDSDDVNYMLGALKQLGIPYETIQPGPNEDPDAGPIVQVTGCDGKLEKLNEKLFLGNAGTAMRPLTAALAIAKKSWFCLEGTPRMHERPIQDLIDALKQWDVDIMCSPTGCPPVLLQAEYGLKGGETNVSGKISSQYLSALLMAAPYAQKDCVINIIDTLVSVPYVEMTIKLMKKFGVNVVNENNKRFTIKAGQRYVSPGEIYVEGDASSASYFLAGAAITGGKVTVVGCGSESVQGDVDFANKLEMMGAIVEWAPNSITVSRDPNTPLKGIDVDCGDIPDAAMTLAVAGLFAQGQTKIRNVYNWRVKETERMKAIVTELTKLGAQVEEGHDYCVVNKPEKIKSGIAIDTYDDHRMAMAFSLAACSGNPVIINDPKCTAKTFPTYFDVLKSLIHK